MHSRRFLRGVPAEFCSLGESRSDGATAQTLIKRAFSYVAVGRRHRHLQTGEAREEASTGVSLGERKRTASQHSCTKWRSFLAEQELQASFDLKTADHTREIEGGFLARRTLRRDCFTTGQTKLATLLCPAIGTVCRPRKRGILRS